MARLPEPGQDALYVFDLSGWIHRFAHAGPTGMAWAARNFGEMLKRIGRDQRPTHACVAADVHGHPTFRHQLDSEYKATRAERPQAERNAVLGQIAVAKMLCWDVFGIPVYEARGYEADDVIATVVEQAVHLMPIVVVATDKDMMQLVSASVVMWNPTNGGGVTGWQQVIDKFGVPPTKVVDYLAICGDSCDNVKGIRGVGPVGAVQILKYFRTLNDAVRIANEGKDKAHAERDKFYVENPKLWAKLADRDEDAEQALRLVRLATDVPIKFDIKECVVDRWPEPD